MQLQRYTCLYYSFMGRACAILYHIGVGISVTSCLASIGSVGLDMAEYEKDVSLIPFKRSCDFLL